MSFFVKAAIILGFLLSHNLAIAQSKAPKPAALSAEFLTTQCQLPCVKPNKHSWWMLRDTDRVELRNINLKTKQLSQFSQIWRESVKGRLDYLYIMHEYRRAIEYLFDDLKILRIPADTNKWQVVNNLLTEQEFKQLTKTNAASANYQGYETERYTGVIDDKTVELIWIPSLKLPAKLVFKNPTHKTTIELKTVEKAAQHHNAPFSSTQALLDYQTIYFTDIGDMELNGEAHEWMAQAPGAPGISSHHH